MSPCGAVSASYGRPGMAFTGSSVGEIKERPVAALLDLRGPDEERLAHGAMDELRAAAARMSEAQRVADIGSWEWRVSDDRVTWSDHLFRIFGLDPATFEPSYEGFLRQVHPGDRALVRVEIETAVRERRPYRLEHRVTVDGSERVLRCKGEPIVDETGTVVRVVGVCQDVTDAKRSDRTRIAFTSAVDARVEPIPAPEPPGRAISDSGAEEVRAALRAGDLLLYAQPAVDLRSGEVAHREVLVRMRGSADSVVPASDVLAAAAQEPGLCAELDRWVVDQALASLANGSRGTRLHINLSGETLNDGRALARFVRVLHGAAERTRWLGLEIGEAAIQRNVVAASAAARQLAATGCPLVLDGFTGTQGAFEQLQRLPLDQVKIDGPVTRELMNEDADDATLRAIVRLAHGTGKTTVAKRVESQELVPILRRRGVDMAQGFELGSPSPLGD